jgi:hypothetical protein
VSHRVKFLFLFLERCLLVGMSRGKQLDTSVAIEAQAGNIKGQ